jgi:hypothetical protein
MHNANGQVSSLLRLRPVAVAVIAGRYVLVRHLAMIRPPNRRTLRP